MQYITIPSRTIPVIDEVDVCVLGGSCTGVFAAVRAARLGASVAIVEKLNAFGSTATAGLVNVWHTLLDADFNEQVIGGLTWEVEQRLLQEKAAEIVNTDSVGVRFNSARLTVLLDQLVMEHEIHPYLHTMYCSPILENRNIQGIIVQNKDGAGIIKAKFFIDASGDGDIARDLQLEGYRGAALQPPTSCFLMDAARDTQYDIGKLIYAHGDEFGLDDDWGWNGPVVGSNTVTFRADNHVFNVDCSKAADLTAAEIEGRRRAAAYVDLLRKYEDPGYQLISLCSSIGVRETVHYKARYQATEQDLLLGKTYDNTIMKGTYRLDVHHQNDNGITFKYLDGRTETFYGKDTRTVLGNWRTEAGITGPSAKYYSLPWESLVQERIDNLILAGRMIDADESAFGAIRVMVNLNQIGEAAGVAAALCVNTQTPVQKLDGRQVTETLRQGGSLV